MLTHNSRGFTLVEILIVVIILGILAGIVISQVASATNDARETALVTELQTVRGELERYRLGHRNEYPTAFVDQLLNKTDTAGNPDDAGHCGPYLPRLPTNPFNQKTTVQEESGPAGLGDSSHGWHYDTSTGQFHPDDAAHAQM